MAQTPSTRNSMHHAFPLLYEQEGSTFLRFGPAPSYILGPFGGISFL